jgi:hypothetical protein
VLVAVADVHGDADAAFGFDSAVEVEGAVEDVFCVFAFELEERFVARADEGARLRILR